MKPIIFKLALVLVIISLISNVAKADEKNKSPELASLPALISNSYDWGRVRIHRPAYPAGPYSAGEQVITLGNSGTKEILISKSIIESDLNDLGKEDFAVDNNSFKNIVIPPGESRYVPVTFQPKVTGEYELVVAYVNTENSTTQTVLRGIGTVPRIVTHDVSFGQTAIKDESDESLHKIRITNLPPNEWEYCDDVTISGFSFEPQGSVALGQDYGTFGFRLDPDAITINDGNGNESENNSLPITLPPGGYLEFDVHFLAQSTDLVQVKLTTVSDAESDVSSQWIGAGENIGVAESNNESGILISPNPAQSGKSLNLKFDIPESGKASIDIYDASGRYISRLSDSYYSAGNNEITLRLPELSKGSYIINIATDDNVISAGFLVK